MLAAEEVAAAHAAAAPSAETECGPAMAANSGISRLLRDDEPAEGGTSPQYTCTSLPLLYRTQGCPRKKWKLVPGQGKPWTPNGKHLGLANGPIPPEALAPGMKVTSAKRGLCERRLARLAKQLTLAEY
jgi:hypothetical protein